VKTAPYIPIYSRPPNRLLEYVDRVIDDGCGHSGVEKVAVFLDRKGRRCEMTAQVVWRGGGDD